MFQVDLDKPWNYLWYCYEKAPLPTLHPFEEARGEMPPLSGVLGTETAILIPVNEVHLELLSKHIKSNPPGFSNVVLTGRESESIIFVILPWVGVWIFLFPESDLKKYADRNQGSSVPLRKFYTAQMFVLVRMQLRNHVYTQPVKRFKR